MIIRSKLTKEIVLGALRNYAYEMADGRRVFGSPVSQVPEMLREAGWRNVPRADANDFRALGLEVVKASYLSWGGKKRPCDVVVKCPVPADFKAPREW